MSILSQNQTQSSVFYNVNFSPSRQDPRHRESSQANPSQLSSSLFKVGPQRTGTSVKCLFPNWPDSPVQQPEKDDGLSHISEPSGLYEPRSPSLEEILDDLNDMTLFEGLAISSKSEGNSATFEAGIAIYERTQSLLDEIKKNIVYETRRNWRKEIVKAFYCNLNKCKGSQRSARIQGGFLSLVSHVYSNHFADLTCIVCNITNTMKSSSHLDQGTGKFTCLPILEAKVIPELRKHYPHYRAC